MEQFYNSIGVIRSLWNHQNKLPYISYGTAFAIAPRLILTCTHNVFHDYTQSYANDIIFIPGIQQGYMNHHRQYKAIKVQSERLLFEQHALPVEQELALILLEEELETDRFLNVVSPNDEDNAQNHNLTIIGYPSEAYYNKMNMDRINIQRETREGNIDSNNCNGIILSYTMKTGIGFSGSPIIINEQGKPKHVIGMHSHRGQSETYNSGIKFTQQLLDKLDKWKEQIKHDYELQSSFKTNTRHSPVNLTRLQSQNCEIQSRIDLNSSKQIQSQDNVQEQQGSNKNYQQSSQTIQIFEEESNSNIKNYNEFNQHSIQNNNYDPFYSEINLLEKNNQQKLKYANKPSG